ncbi:MAG: gas vesicle protein K [Gemmatimonadota bacterium]
MTDDRIDADDLELFAAELGEIAPALPARIDASPEDVEAGLGKLVLTLIEFLRQVLEHQAVRRMEGGTLSDEEIERLGLALMRLQERLEEIKNQFGLEGEDLNIDLGPLGRLI